MHYEASADESEKTKPQIINHYNKGGVDLMNKKIGTYTCKRYSKRWPFADFCNMLDVAALNSYQIFVNKNQEYNSVKSHNSILMNEFHKG
jgi:hypothetical protein